MVRSRVAHRVGSLVWLFVMLVAGCARWATPPRYGSLTFDDKRKFGFDHGIDLFETTNGMKFALRRDPRSRVATVDVRYDVGAANDPPGRAGMAHLVEHLLFEIRDRPGAPPLSAQLAEFALSYNAETSWDGTHYTMTVPADQLEAAIALEGARMRTTCEQLDDATVARERAVVIAENAQRGAVPPLYAEVMAAIYGKGHPYTRPISTDEISSATRAEVCAFIAASYAPERAALVVTGDFDVAHLRSVIGKTFGPIDRKAIAPAVVSTAPKLSDQVVRITGAVDHPAVMVAVALPTWGTSGSATMRTLRWLLSGALARVDRAHRWVVASAVEVVGDARAPTLVLSLSVSDPSQLEAASEEIYRQLDQAPKVAGWSNGSLSTIMALDTIARWDDAGARGDWIAQYLQYTDHKWFVLQPIRELALPWDSAFPVVKDLLARARTTRILITPGASASGQVAPPRPLSLTPRELHVWRTAVDPAEADAPAAVPAITPSPIERFELDNGLTVELAADDDGAMVDARLVFPVGYAHAGTGNPLVPSAAAEFLDFDGEGYYDMSDYRRIAWARARGTVSDVHVGETATTFLTAGLYHYGDWHLWYLATLVDQGRYNSFSIDAARAFGRRIVAADKRTDDDDGDDEATRVLRERLYGVGHPFTRSGGGSGGAELASLTASELGAWKAAHFRPRGATLIVSGRFDPVAMKREIVELFGPWADVAPAPLPTVPTATPRSTASWLAFEAKDATQVRARLAFAIAPVERDAAHSVMAAMLDDELRDVREAMGASYGVYADYWTSPYGGQLLISGAVDEGLAGPAMQRMIAVVERLRTDDGIRRLAFVRARRKLVLAAAAGQAGATALAGRLAAAAADGERYESGAIAARVAAVTLAEITELLTRELDPAHMVVAARGRKPALDAAFAILGHEPERFDDDAPEPVADAPTVTDDGDAPPTQPAEPADTTPFVALRVGAGDDANLYQGDRTVSRAEFLRLAGRSDLNDRMRRRLWLRIGLVTIGAGVAIGGVTYSATRDDCPASLPAREEAACVSRGERRSTLGGLVAVTGASMMIAAHYLSNAAPDRERLREIAARYNTRRGRIAAPSSAPTVELTPVMTATEAGFAVIGTF